MSAHAPADHPPGGRPAARHRRRLSPLTLGPSVPRRRPPFAGPFPAGSPAAHLRCRSSAFPRFALPSSFRLELCRALASASAVLAACRAAAASSDAEADGFTPRVGLTAVNGALQGNLGWGDEKGLLLDALRPAGVKKIDFALFQSGKDVTAALLAGEVRAKEAAPRDRRPLPDTAFAAAWGLPWPEHEAR